jgi:hypothetical protein
MATKEIKWGQRCIARRFKTVNGTAVWQLNKEEFVGKEGIVTRLYNDGSVLIDFKADGNGKCFEWLTSALEPIPETPNVWWPGFGAKVMHNGKIKTVTSIRPYTHELDGSGEFYNARCLSPVTTTEITPEEAIALLQQHTGKSFTIKSK